jgi:hypothetical protein
MMTIPSGAGAPDYFPCHYGAAKAVFRGPERDLTHPYIAMLGGSPTFGKYVAEPYPALVERALGMPVANLAGLNAGPDFYLTNPSAVDIAARATAVVVQITGAEAVSNPLYTVHSRRNDRFLAATPALRALFPKVDFAEIHFTRHLLIVLDRADPDRFQTVVGVLKANWLAKMQALLARLPHRSLLLWLADKPAPDSADTLDAAPGPLFIDRPMLDSLGRRLIEAIPSEAARAEGASGMFFPETEAQQAHALPGSAVHVEVAARLAPALQGLTAMEKGPPNGDPR